MPDAPTVRPLILDAGLVTRLLGEPNFYAAIPEFLPMKQQVNQMQLKLKTGRGCSSCRKRRIQRTLFTDFLSIFRSLGDEGTARFKKYIGAGAVMLQHRDPRTKQQKVEII